MAPAALLYARGARPDVSRIAAISERGGEFALSHRPADEEGWVELLAAGLTFDLGGLVPGAQARVAECAHRFGFSAQADFGVLEAVSLAPGPHIAAGAALLPVVRTQVGLLVALARSSGATAVAWAPARAASSVDWFADCVGRWLAGGPFPMLGLAALRRNDEGALVSEGLDYLIGCELRLVTEGPASAADARLAMRLGHWLVEGGGIEDAEDVAFEGFAPLRLEPISDGRWVEARVLP